MEGPQSFPMPTYICGVQARPYLKTDVPQDNQDFLATRQVTAESLGVRPEYIEILPPVLIAPECSTAIMSSQWLTTLPPDIAMGTRDHGPNALHQTSGILQHSHSLHRLQRSSQSTDIPSR